MKEDEILDTLERAGMRISRHELSALFRSREQSQYRPCNDQLLRNFLNGLQSKTIAGEKPGKKLILKKKTDKQQG
jgi:uncharacterized protein YehS (DUF1456 family)